MVKTTTRWLLASLVCLALWPAVAHVQVPELMDAYNRYSELYAEGRYQEALPFAEKALRLSEREFGPDDPNVAIDLNNLAALYHAQGRYPEAEPLHQRALVIWEKAFGPDHPDVATGLENYAALLREVGRESEAEEMEARAEAIRVKLAEEARSVRRVEAFGGVQGATLGATALAPPRAPPRAPPSRTCRPHGCGAGRMNASYGANGSRNRWTRSPVTGSPDALGAVSFSGGLDGALAEFGRELSQLECARNGCVRIPDLINPRRWAVGKSPTDRIKHLRVVHESDVVIFDK